MAIITGTAGDDKHPYGIELRGTNLSDQIFGLAGNDALVGFDGDDVLEGGAGADILDGGAGFDIASYTSSGAAVFVTLFAGYADGGHAAGDQLDGIEGLIGSAFADGLTGDGDRNVLRGLGGDDSLSGGGSDDTLEGGAGGDFMDGGDGFDVASYEGSNAAVFADLVYRNFSGGHAAGDFLSSIEGLIGSAYGDLFFGDAGRNVLRGLGGNDRLFGGGDNDALDGGGGNDLLDGGAGADELRGGSGIDTVSFDNAGLAVAADLANGLASGDGPDRLSGIENLTGSDFGDQLAGNEGANVLAGGYGGDVLAGRGGADRFDYNILSDSSLLDGTDLILDFSRTQGDRIDLAGVDANQQASGGQAFTFLGTKPFTGAGQLRFFQQNGDTFVEANTYGTSGAEMTIRVDPLVAFQATDFVL